MTRERTVSRADVRLIAEAMDAYNSVVRTAAQIAKRDGEDTDWANLRNRVRAVLEAHHATWVRFSPWLASTGAGPAAEDSTQC